MHSVLQNRLGKRNISISEMIFFVVVRVYRTLVEMEQWAFGKIIQDK